MTWPLRCSEISETGWYSGVHQYKHHTMDTGVCCRGVCWLKIQILDTKAWPSRSISRAIAGGMLLPNCRQLFARNGSSSGYSNRTCFGTSLTRLLDMSHICLALFIFRSIFTIITAIKIHTSPLYSNIDWQISTTSHCHRSDDIKIYA